MDEMERVDSLWFPDGNIVICAHNVLFKVFRGILAARSPVFADMLAFPQPEDAETIEGVPVLHLDNSAADTMYFLKAIFDYEFFAPYPAKTDFDAIHGVLRLGQKYRVEPLRQRALQHLSSAHPTTLAAWDALCAGPSTSSSSAAQLAPFAGGASWDFEHLELPIITLARAARADWILPTAFYRALAALGSAEILDGIDYTGVHVELDRGDKVLCLEAAPVLLGDAVSEMLGFLWSPAVIPGCERALPPPSSTSSPSPSTTATHTHTTSDPGIGMNACTADRFALRATAERWRRDALLPLALGADSDGDGEGGEGGRAIWGEEDFARLTVCAPCLAHMKADWAARRARFWAGLPGLFGLAGWEALERERERGLGGSPPASALSKRRCLL
ncbi:hypothetical protein C8R44DRAFT_846519 [Mycena epipterygia]|nr:hypothetical protein C8R44DRAFT_846519 [Mycena epipterygia]